VPFDHLNRRFIELKNIAFSVYQEADNDFKVKFDNLNHRFFNFIEVAFGLVKGQNLSLQCLENTGKVGFLTSPKSHFGLVQWPKVC